jgi:hypothetical protein
MRSLPTEEGFFVRVPKLAGTGAAVVKGLGSSPGRETT